MTEKTYIDGIIAAAELLRAQYGTYAFAYRAAAVSKDARTMDNAMCALEALNHGILGIYKLGVEALDDAAK